VAGNEIERPYERGLSCTEIAGIVGSGGNPVYNHLTAAGTRMRSRSEVNQKLPDRIAKALYNLALSASQIGHLLGGHSTTVVKRLRRCSFPLRPAATALAVGYTPEEFERHSCTPTFLDDLSTLIGA